MHSVSSHCQADSNYLNTNKKNLRKSVKSAVQKSKSLSPVCDHPRTGCIRDFFAAQGKPLRLHRVDLSELKERDVTIDLVRDDLLHPMIAGNKWWKLKHALIHAAEQGKNTLVTFGGAYSNHLLAVAGAGHLFGFKTVGLVRGDEARALNPVLSQAQRWGMHLEGISRERYRQKHDPAFTRQLETQWSPCLVLPEGGSGPLAVKGTREMVERLTTPHDYVCCSVGTGGTLAGIVSGAQKDVTALGFSSLKGGAFLEKEVERLLEGHPIGAQHWSIETRYHFGGYAKSDETLRAFCQSFEQTQNVALDPVYTGKMMFGLMDLVRKNTFPPQTRIIAYHTGNTKT
jgi:1-aminocyclopropane-1-carboxylate deaminase